MGRDAKLTCRPRRTQDGAGRFEYLVEACDPCEADACTIDGIAVSDSMRLLTSQGGLPRASWDSVIAGVILPLTIYLVLSVLGAAIGTSALAPPFSP